MIATSELSNVQFNALIRLYFYSCLPPDHFLVESVLRSTEPFGMLSQLACRGGITQNNSHPSLACLHNQTVITLLITADLLIYNSFEFLAKY